MITGRFPVAPGCFAASLPCGCVAVCCCPCSASETDVIAVVARKSRREIAIAASREEKQPTVLPRRQQHPHRLRQQKKTARRLYPPCRCGETLLVYPASFCAVFWSARK